MNKRPLRVLALAAFALTLVLTGTALATTPYAQTKRHHATVVVTETEWHITLSHTSAPAGSVTFEVRNRGKLPHELIVVRTARSAAKLPVRGTEVDVKAAGTLVGKVAAIEPGKTTRITVRLEKGRYVLLCNLPAHYKQGQFAAFDVT